MDIFQYENYRLFLKDYIKRQPRKGRGYTLKIATELQMHPTMVSQIFSGSKDFTSEQALKLSQFLLLGSLETEYFILLVQKERSGTRNYRDFIEQKMKEIKESSTQVTKRLKADRVLNENQKSIFYSHWLYSAVRLFCSIGPGQTFESIEKRFQIDRERASQILKFLLTAELIVDKAGVFSIGPLLTHLDSKSPFVPRYHSNWRLKAIQKSDFLHSQELMFSGPISISKKDFSKIRESLLQVISNTMKVVKDSPAEEVACFNCDLFWI